MTFLNNNMFDHVIEGNYEERTVRQWVESALIAEADNYRLRADAFAASWERMVLLAAMRQFSAHSPSLKFDKWRQFMFEAFKEAGNAWSR